MVEWTKEKIAAQSDQQLKALRANAEKYARHDIVALCDEELNQRKPKRQRATTTSENEDHTGHYVSEFHFVCPNELGITRNPDGTIWTGTWVVAEDHARNAVRYNAHVALHSSKSEQSYLHGIIKDWRKSQREPQYTGDAETQIREGIDFLFEVTNSPMIWVGAGSGEKGYAWKEIEA